MMSLTCFAVAFLCVGMAMGGATSDFYTFTLMWFLHLIGGSMYTACTVAVPAARYSTDGEKCAKLAPVNGDRSDAVYLMHAFLYLFYGKRRAAACLSTTTSLHHVALRHALHPPASHEPSATHYSAAMPASYLRHAV